VPARDLVVTALTRAGWTITDDPYVITYGLQVLLIDLAANTENQGRNLFVDATRDGHKIAVEIKAIAGESAVADLHQAVGQYVVYKLVLEQLEPDRIVYLAVTDAVYRKVFRRPLGQLIVQRLPLRLLVVNQSRMEVEQWVPSIDTET
jgi:hypothetical protein